MKEKIDLLDIHVYGVEEKLLDRFYFRNLLINLLEYDEFAKKVDLITGSKIANKKTLEEKQEELNLIIHNGSRGAIVMNLALKYFMHLADAGLNEVLDLYWRERLNKYRGFVDVEKSKR